jgi:hypothetical protein
VPENADNTDKATRRHGALPEFFSPLPLLTVALFGLNNFVFKARFGNWLTGKLSDITACFFLPLFLSALLGMTTRLALRRRMLIGCVVTAIVFSAVKVSPLASSVLDGALSVLSQTFGWGASRNLVDPAI